MTVFLIVLAVLFLLVLFLLLLDVSLVFSYDDEVAAKVSVLFLTFDALSFFEKTVDSGKNLPVERTEGKKKRARLRGPDEVIEIIGYFVTLVKAVLRETRRYVRLKICRISVVVASDDAARTAQTYGTVSALVWGLVALFDNTLKTKWQEKKINVIPDFTKDESSVKLKLVLKLKILHALLAVMHLLPLLMNNRKAGLKK
jgi:hypothetical protein